MSAFPKPAPDAQPHDAEVTVTHASGHTTVDMGANVRKRDNHRAERRSEVVVGTTIGSYVVESTLGAGGCGQVYAARHKDTGRRAAIKVLRSDMANVPTAVPRFVREVEALSRIAHEGIVEVYDIGEIAPGIPYYVMELLDGVDLRQLLKVHQRFSPSEALALLEPVGRALHFAHERGIIHRDIKASNIFVTTVDGKRVVKLLDFGIAKLLYGEHGGDGLTAPGTVIGTPHAIAPEQIRGEALDCRADVYSLGVLTFLLVTGHYPFRDANPNMLTLMHLQALPPRPSATADVPQALDEVVLKCMAKSPADRYATVPEFIEALRRAVGDHAQATEGSRRLATAVGFRLEVGGAADQELDDEMIEDISSVLDLVEGELASHDFDFPLRASNTLTAVRLVEGTNRERFSIDEAQELLESIKTMLAERETAHPGVVVSLSMREDAVEFRESSEGVEYVGGPLLDTDKWSGSTHA